MKTPSAQSLRRLKFKIRFFGDYAEQIGQLKKIPALKPEKLRALNQVVFNAVGGAIWKKK